MGKPPKPQTKFTLDNDERTYLRWVAKTMYFMDYGSEHEIAKLLLRSAISSLRREYINAEPPIEEMRRIVGDESLTDDVP